MADRTYQELNIGEIRKVELTIEDQDGLAFIPSAAYIQVNDKDGNVIIPKQSAVIQNNLVNTTIGTVVTSAEGRYNLIWDFHKNGLTYYHCTELEIVQLCIGD